MFDLEQEITEWRRQMSAAGITTPGVLNELECHLREDVEQQTRAGLSVQPAFELAVRRIGQADLLRAEFKKTGGPKALRPGKLLGIACGVLAGFFSLMLMPKLLHAPELSLAARMLGLSAVATTVMTWLYGHRFLPVIRSQRVRTLIGVVCCTAGASWMAFFINRILPHLFERPAGADLPVGLLFNSFGWALTLVAVLGSIAYGVEKAAGRPNTATDP